MPDPTVILRSQGDLTEQRLVVSGYVSTNRPAPTSFGDTLWVILPLYSLERPFGPCEWGAIHGDALPQQGAAVTIIFDEQNIPVVVWWQGENIDTGWITATLENSWVETGGATIEYRRDGNVVRLRGRAKGGASNSIALTLPESLRPPKQVVQPAYQVTTGVLGSVVVETSGKVKLTYTSGSTPAMSVDGVNYTVD